MPEWGRDSRLVRRSYIIILREERRRLLCVFVDFFNHEWVHGTLGMTPMEKLAQYAKRQENGDNAV